MPYNDLAAVEAAFAEHGDQIACVITEAAAGNMGVVPAGAGFTQALRRARAEHGALLISDEVMTGFRVARRLVRAGGREGWPPDLLTFGKVMGGGFPAAAFGGRADIMAMLAPAGRSTRPARCRGTRSPPPPASRRCGLHAEASTAVDAAAGDGRAGARSTRSTPSGVAARRAVRRQHVQRLLQRATTVRDYDDASRRTPRRYAAFFHAMLDAGVYLPPSAFEAWFLSAAHDDAALDRIVAALPPPRARRPPPRPREPARG